MTSLIYTMSSQTSMTWAVVVVAVLGLLLEPGATSTFRTICSTDEQGHFRNSDPSVPLEVSACGQPPGMCVCSEDVAVCRNYTAAHSLPELPPSIRVLDLVYNAESFAPDPIINVNYTHFFRHVGFSVQVLCIPSFLHFNSSTFSGDVFANLTHLKVHGSEFNTVVCPAGVLRSFLSLPTLTELFVGSCNMNWSTVRETFQGINESFLRSLTLQTISYISKNFGTVPLDVFGSLTNLTYLDLSDNTLSGVDTFGAPRLERLNLDDSDVSDLSQICNTTTTPSDRSFDNATRAGLPALTDLSVKNCEIDVLARPAGCDCFPHLAKLELSMFSVDIISPFAFSSCSRLTSVEFAGSDFTDTSLSLCLLDCAFCSPSLESLNLRYGNVHFGKSCPSVETGSTTPVCSACVADTAFRDVPELTTLLLDGNDLSEVDTERFVTLFGRLTKLDTLTLEVCQMTRLSEDMFANFPRLRFLDVGNNFLTVLDGGSLGSLPNLVFLFLDNNYIASVAGETLAPETRDGLKDLTLYGNRLVCSCDLLWLQEWLRTDPGLFQSDRYGYVCDNIPDTNITDFPLPQQACMMKREVSSFIIGVCSLIIFTFTSATLFFAYRWHLRLLCFEAFRGQGDRRRQRLAQKQFDFDIFVSYESEDLPWVRKHLMAELEDRQGLKLCIHQRDFIPGHYIVDNIADSVESSKKVMMVFSKSFVLSQWCQFELTYCLSHVMDYDDSLIVVCVDDVVSRDMTGPMMAVLKTTTYIQWEEAPQDAVRAFWGRMRLALAEILPRRPANPPVNRRAIDRDTGVNPPANLDNRPANPADPFNHPVNPPANRPVIDPDDSRINYPVNHPDNHHAIHPDTGVNHPADPVNYPVNIDVADPVPDAATHGQAAGLPDDFF